MGRTPLSGGAPRAAAAYAAVDRATRSVATGEPLWLPAGWLAVVLLLTAVAPSLGAPAATDGWRARGPAKASPVAAARSKTPRPTAVRSHRSVSSRPIKQVAWHDDLAGPALRIAQRDELFDTFERPFGAEASAPEAEPLPENTTRPSDADTADSLFNDSPPPAPQDLPPADDYRDADEGDVGSLFNDTEEPVEPIAPGDPTDDYAPEIDDLDVQRRAQERAAAQQECETAFDDLRNNRLAAIDLSIRVTGQEGEDFPYECRLNTGEVLAPRCWSEITYTWKASGLCHKPLYFEDVHLERYGHSWGPYVQPLVSGAHFFGRLPVLPYMMGLKTPNECVYTLGHYRPGNCAPYLIDPIPFTWRAALYQTGGVFGVAGFLP